MIFSHVSRQCMLPLDVFGFDYSFFVSDYQFLGAVIGGKFDLTSYNLPISVSLPVIFNLI